MILFKIGAVHYEIKRVENLIRDNGFFGYCNSVTNEIAIESNMALERVEQTVCHELVHAMLIESGYTADQHDEEMVERLGITLHQFLKDNFELESVFFHKGVYGEDEDV